MKDFKSRKNTISGEYLGDDIIDTSFIYQEWWNGEGFDFSFYDEKGNITKTLSLHLLEIEAIASIGVFHNFLGIEDIQEKVTKLKRKQKEYEDKLKR